MDELIEYTPKNKEYVLDEKSFIGFIGDCGLVYIRAGGYKEVTYRGVKITNAEPK